jgi:hypothetical protein
MTSRGKRARPTAALCVEWCLMRTAKGPARHNQPCDAGHRRVSHNRDQGWSVNISQEYTEIKWDSATHGVAYSKVFAVGL